LAYEADRPIHYMGTLYVPGTRSFHDLIDDAAIVLGVLKHTKSYGDAERAYLRSPTERIVGHSLGAAVAAELAKHYTVYDVGFGSPVKNSANYADSRDIVGSFVASDNLRNNQPYIHHGTSYYSY